MGPLGERMGMADQRRLALASAAGRVVEIGAGTGLNFRHYPVSVSEVLATEPDPHMLKRARRAVERAGVAIRVERAPAEALPVPDEWADVVVSTLALCSVSDPAVALSETHRVLRPGGRLLFVEHVRSEDPRLAERQDRRQRSYSFFAGGCHPNRDTLASIGAAGLQLADVERYAFGPSIVRPHVRGSAVRPG